MEMIYHMTVTIVSKYQGKGEKTFNAKSHKKLYLHKL